MASKTLPPFLRPLPRTPPPISGRLISTHPPLSQRSIPSPTNYAINLTFSGASTAKVAPAIQNPLSPLPYHIHRTASQQLPIYHLAKRGGNLHQTRIRKIDGDLMELKKDLRQALGLREEHIAINQLTRHIVIKVRCGLRRLGVTLKEWLLIGVFRRAGTERTSRSS